MLSGSVARLLVTSKLKAGGPISSTHLESSKDNLIRHAAARQLSFSPMRITSIGKMHRDLFHES